MAFEIIHVELKLDIIYNNGDSFYNNDHIINYLLIYILIFILQYIPIIIYDICVFLKIRNIVLDALILAVISFGGIGNVIQYLYNEGLSNKNNTSNYGFDSNERSAITITIIHDYAIRKLNIKLIYDVIINTPSEQ
ncbi:hypothetical protein RhiirA4_485618 [Rhizophagus irregularis]|uniref:Uncharacterized protein n=1 Tax=Rhizophagus irregularis TaxID=588596 RepID=A0A2I1HQD5_9GLOM|nr:hypothetical protein RhiirA4_485618 [Rhizophagus irregularis]